MYKSHATPDLCTGTRSNKDVVNFFYTLATGVLVMSSSVLSTAKGKISVPRNDFDNPWKQILDLYFRDFIAYCWPAKYREINWNKKPQALDKELVKITKNAVVTNRHVDKLFKVYRRNGKEAFVLLHLEVESTKGSKFGQRMLEYRTRLRNVYNQPIASLAILIDKHEKWRPMTYKEEFWDSSLEVKFNTIKLIDYKSKIEDLKISNNRFAPVILAQLAAMQTQGPEAKLIGKIALTRSLYDHGWTKNDIMNLYRFIDWVMTLTPHFELQYHKALEEIEEELKVEYITTAERIGEIKILLYQLQHKFKTIPEKYRAQMEKANAETLLKLSGRVLECQTIDEVFVS